MLITKAKVTLKQNREKMRDRGDAASAALLCKIKHNLSRASRSGGVSKMCTVDNIMFVSLSLSQS